MVQIRQGAADAAYKHQNKGDGCNDGADSSLDCFFLDNGLGVRGGVDHDGGHVIVSACRDGLVDECSGAALGVFHAGQDAFK